MAKPAPITIIGAGILGLWQARSFSDAGYTVAVYERQARGLRDAASSLAGAMLAPYCELEAAEAVIGELGREAVKQWLAAFSQVKQAGTLVVSHARDLPELDRFARAAPGFQWVDQSQISQLEPDLDGRFSRGLFYPKEGHIVPREIMRSMIDELEGKGVDFHFGQNISSNPPDGGWLIDCRGIDAQDDLGDLRGVKGEMLVLKNSEVSLSRPIRLMHPRHPLYIVPWGNDTYMVGASMIEADGDLRVTAKSVLELLSAAYTVHPAFGDAEVLEMRCGMRPAFPDNLPRIIRRDKRLYINGIFRHGFLLAPAMAKMTLDYVRSGIQPAEFFHEG